ncbi:MAG: hypothetical protein EPN19_06970 [Betaproteobacteria bacterium]|nr:MAG: hypothetical protein EPN19_06970 [Betaproteobacteria bacterium]
MGEAVSLEGLEALDEPSRERWLLPLERLLRGLPRVDLDRAAAVRFAQGRTVTAGGALTGRCQVFDHAGRLIGVGEPDGRGELRPVRLLTCAADLLPAAAKAGKTL